MYKTLTARALSCLCLSLALGECEKVTVMVLVGQRSFWDVSLTLRPGTISGHSNGLEHWEKGEGGWACHPPFTPAAGEALTDRLAPSYPLISHWQWIAKSTPSWSAALYFTPVRAEVSPRLCVRSRSIITQDKCRRQKRCSSENGKWMVAVCFCYLPRTLSSTVSFRWQTALSFNLDPCDQRTKNLWSLT